MKRFLPASLLLLPLLGGCVAVAVVAAGAAIGIGTYAYVHNELQREYQCPYEKAWEAASQAPVEMKLTPQGGDHDFQRGFVDARRADGAPVRITVEKIDDQKVRIGVRVGTFECEDNRQAATAVHERIFVIMGGKP